jgi:hypothetical protein
MNKISSGLKTLFLVHCIVGLVFGLGYLLIPGKMMAIMGVTPLDEYPWRLVGAAILAFTASSWFGYKADVWDKVRIIVIAEICWTTLVVLAGLYGLFFAGQPTALWINVILMAIFAAAFGYFYSKK